MQRVWLARLVWGLPRWVPVFVEAVRIGQDTRSWVRVSILGRDCGIWRTPKGGC